jgi:hypothetical protein
MQIAKIAAFSINENAAKNLRNPIWGLSSRVDCTNRAHAIVQAGSGEVIRPAHMRGRAEARNAIVSPHATQIDAVAVSTADASHPAATRRDPSLRYAHLCANKGVQIPVNAEI